MRFLKNIRTTVVGIATLLSGLGLLGAALKGALDGHPSLEAFSAAFAAIGAGVGLILAKDANVTGGTVPATAEAAARVASPTPPAGA